jgi:hypothetical protein
VPVVDRGVSTQKGQRVEHDLPARKSFFGLEHRLTVCPP